MIEKLIEGIKGFAKERCFLGSDYNLNVEKGQSAKILVIGCADSLVDPYALMNASPGELFIHRNIAGLVPPFNNHEDNIHATSAILDFAINTLDVDDIIVLGHGHCGGIKAVLNNRFSAEKKGYAASWVEIVKPAITDLLKDNTDLAPEKQRPLCEQEATRVSMENVKTFPCVQRKLAAGELSLHAWHFDRGIFSIYENGQWVVKS